MRRLFDRLQLTLHLLGLHELAMFVGRWGTPALEPGDPPLRMLKFDPTFQHNEGIDVSKDIAWPTSKYDVN